MRKQILPYLAAAAIAIVTCSTALAAPETFKFDKNHTLIGFRIRHFVSKVEGRFKDFEGSITLDRQNPAGSKVDLTIQATSIDTSNENRDKHLRSADFFDVEKFPTITFKSTKVTPKGTDAFDVTGDFTMRGVTKSLTVPVKLGGFVKAGKVEKVGFELGGFILNRKDFGIVWNSPVEAGGLMLGDDVEINCQVEANRPLEAPAPAAAPPAKSGS